MEWELSAGVDSEVWLLRRVESGGAALEAGWSGWSGPSVQG